MSKKKVTMEHSWDRFGINIPPEVRARIDQMRAIMKVKSDEAFDAFIALQKKGGCAPEKLEELESSDFYREFACEIFVKGVLTGRMM